MNDWTDERINSRLDDLTADYVDLASDEYWPKFALAQDNVIREMRAEYQAALAAAHAEIAQLNTALDTASRAVSELEVEVEELEAAPQVEPLALPDGTGRWAFVGKHYYDKVELVVNIVEWDKDIGEGIRVYRFEGDRYPIRFRKEFFCSEYDGKWYKLTMPWEGG